MLAGASRPAPAPAPKAATPVRTGAPKNLQRSPSTLTIGFVIGLGLLFLACIVSISFGSRSIAWSSVLEAIFNNDPKNFDHLAVNGRIPRTITGLLVGAALGLGGALMQGVARNPLADPGILGVNGGAALGVVLSVNLFGITSLNGYIWFAFVGAALASVVVYGVAATGRSGATPVKLALAGAAVSAALLSVVTAILLTDVETFDRFRFWQAGSLAGTTADLLWQVVPFIGIGLLVALFTGRILNGLSLGDEVAKGLGQNVSAGRLISAICIVVLCGGATAVAGPIAFVGLAVPHISRAIVGADYRWVLPYSMILGPILLLISDVMGRLVLASGELQVGIVTAFFGAPIFILLVRRRKMAQL